MSISVVNTNLPLGCRVSGIDVSNGISDADLILVQSLLNERSVVVLTGQKLSPAQHATFASKFGKLLAHEHSKNIRRDYPGISVLSNVKVDGKLIGVPDAGMVWHTDGSYLDKPDMYTFLYGIEIPRSPEGKLLGNTLFSSTTAAYDALSGAMKVRISSLKAVHSLVYHSVNRAAAGGTRVEITEELKQRIPDHEQPVVRTHPVTGKKCLFVSEGHTTHIVGLPAAESAGLLKELIAHMRKPEFVYSHGWNEGDLVVWDNASTQHRATADYALPQRRLMNRAATEGTVPF